MTQQGVQSQTPRAGDIRRRAEQDKAMSLGSSSVHASAEEKGSRRSSLLGNAQPRPMLTLWDGITTIVSLMIGSGIFVSAGSIHQKVGSAGMALAIWVGSGLLSLTGALCYAELGTMIPGSGGEAQYLARGLGPLFVFLFNWTSIIILKPITVSIMADTTVQYLYNLFFGEAQNASEDTAGFFEYMRSRLVHGLLCLVIAGIAAASTRLSGRVTSVLTYGKIGALAFIILSAAWRLVTSADSRQTLSDNLGEPFKGTTNNYSVFAVALCEGLFSFDGWNNLNIVAGQLRNPAVNLPLSIWISMCAVLTLYTLTLIAYYAVLPVSDILGTDPIGQAFGTVILGSWGKTMVAVLIASSTFSSGLSSMATSSEIVILAAETRQIPAVFGRINRRTGTAVWAYMMQGAIAAALVCLKGFKSLVLVYAVPAWIFYGLCAFVVLRLRQKEASLARPYRVWLATPVMFLLACCVLVASTCKEVYKLMFFTMLGVLSGIPVFYIARWVFPGSMAIPSADVLAKAATPDMPPACLANAKASDGVRNRGDQ